MRWIAQHQRLNGTRDPVVAYHPVYAGVVVALVFVCLRPAMGMADETYGWAFAGGFGAVFLATFGAQVSDNLYSRRLRQRGMSIDAMSLRQVTVAGTAAEVHRLLRSLEAAPAEHACFRTFIGRAQVHALACFFPLLLLPLRAWVTADRLALWAACAGSAFVVVCGWFLRRIRYRVGDGVLTVETLCGLQLAGREEIPLAGAAIECDFGDLTLWIERGGLRRPIYLGGLLYPHAFVARVIAEAKAVVSEAAVHAQPA